MELRQRFDIDAGTVATGVLFSAGHLHMN